MERAAQCQSWRASACNGRHAVLLAPAVRSILLVQHIAWRTKEEGGQEGNGRELRAYQIELFEAKTCKLHTTTCVPFSLHLPAALLFATSPILDKVGANRGNLLLFLARAMRECRVLLSFPAHQSFHVPFLPTSANACQISDSVLCT